MSSKVVNIDEYRPHQAEYVACVNCGKDWVAVAPASCQAFQCPACGEYAGEIIRTDDKAFFNRYMSAARDDEDSKRRTMVLLNAMRQGL